MESTRLCKADIIKGKNNIHYIHFDQLGGELGLSPLTAGQNAIVEAIQARGVKVSADKTTKKNPDPKVEVDTEAAALAAFESDATAVWYSLNGAGEDAWTLEEVKSLRPASVVNAIAEEVFKISGTTKEGKSFIDSFRKD